MITHYLTFGFTVWHLVAAQISGCTKWIRIPCFPDPKKSNNVVNNKAIETNQKAL